MRLMNKSWIIILGAFLIISCNSKKSNQDVFTAMPEDFVSFYDQFHADTSFQIEHIHFPLEGMPALQPGSDLEGFSFWWERKGWKFHKPFDDMNGSFKRNFSSFANIITETIYDQSGQFSMVRRFSKMDGQWKLIYYKQLGRNQSTAEEER